MNFLVKVAYLAASFAAPVCALGAYSNWDVLHGGFVGHAGWSIFLLLACTIATSLLLFLPEIVVRSLVVLPGILLLVVTSAGLMVMFVPVTIMFILSILAGGASIEMISFEYVCGILSVLVIFGSFNAAYWLG